MRLEKGFEKLPESEQSPTLYNRAEGKTITENVIRQNRSPAFERARACRVEGFVRAHWVGEGAKDCQFNKIEAQEAALERAEGCSAKEIKAEYVLEGAKNCTAENILATKYALEKSERCEAVRVTAGEAVGEKARYLLLGVKSLREEEGEIKILEEGKIEAPFICERTYIALVMGIVKCEEFGEDSLGVVCLGTVEGLDPKKPPKIHPSVIMIDPSKLGNPNEVKKKFLKEYYNKAKIEVSIFDYLCYFAPEGNTFEEMKKILAGYYEELKKAGILEKLEKIDEEKRREILLKMWEEKMANPDRITYLRATVEKYLKKGESEI